MLSKQGESLCKPGFKFSSQQSLWNIRCLSYEQCLRSSRGFCSVKGKPKARDLLPEEDVWFWDGRMGREEGDDGVGVGGGDGGEEGGGVEGAGVEEVGGFCVVRNISNRGYRCKDWSENRDLWELEYVRRPDLRV